MDELQNIILSEGSLAEKIACCIISFIVNSRTNRTNLLGQKKKNGAVLAPGVGGKTKSMRELSGMVMFYYLMFCDGNLNLSTSLYVNCISKK